MNLTTEELKLALKGMENGKSPGNDGLVREFYIVFWVNVSDCLLQSLLDAKQKGFFITAETGCN